MSSSATNRCCRIPDRVADSRDRRIRQQQPATAAAPAAADQAAAAATPGRTARRVPRRSICAQAMPLVERALQVLERRAVQPQLGLLKSTMLQLDSASARRPMAPAASPISSRSSRKPTSSTSAAAAAATSSSARRRASPSGPTPKPEEALPALRDVLETHRLEMENGARRTISAGWVQAEVPNFDAGAYGFQEFSEFLNYAQDKMVVRVEPDEEKGPDGLSGRRILSAGRSRAARRTDTAKRKRTRSSPSWKASRRLLEPNPPPVKPKPIRRPRKSSRDPAAGNSDRPPRRSRKKKPEPHHHTMQ